MYTVSRFYSIFSIFCTVTYGCYIISHTNTCNYLHCYTMSYNNVKGVLGAWNTCDLFSFGQCQWIFNPLTPGAFRQNAFFGHFGDFQAGAWPNQPQLSPKGICNMSACFSCHWHCVLEHFGSGVRRNQNFDFRKVTYVFRLFDFLNCFFTFFLFLVFFFFWLQRSTFHWACLQLKIS